MSQALSSQRSWIARISVLAMLASLMAFGAAPAGAAIDTSDACPSTITAAGFTDLAGVPASAVDAINCIADYGISTGTTATTFDPFAEVARWQMALFITRQVTAHGLGSALPAGADQGFTDLGGVPAAAVTAINQIAELGISTGTSATTFDPFATVERWQMALFLARTIDIAIDDNSTTDDNANNMPDGSDQGFTDLTGVPAAAVTAINQIAQLDVADGTTATTFDPFAAVERWAMALFLARTLAADGITPAPVAADATVPTLVDAELDATALGETRLTLTLSEDIGANIDETNVWVATWFGDVIPAKSAEKGDNDNEIDAVWDEEDVDNAVAVIITGDGDEDTFGAAEDIDGNKNLTSSVAYQSATVDSLDYYEAGAPGDNGHPELVSVSGISASNDDADFTFDGDLDDDNIAAALAAVTTEFVLVLDDGSTITSTGANTGTDGDDEVIEVDFNNIGNNDDVVRALVLPSAVSDDDGDVNPPMVVDVASGGATSAPDLVAVTFDADGDDEQATFEFDENVDSATIDFSAFWLVYADGTWEQATAAEIDASNDDQVDVTFGAGALDAAEVLYAVVLEAGVESFSDGATNGPDMVSFSLSFAAGRTAGPDLVTTSGSTVGLSNDVYVLVLEFDEDVLDGTAFDGSDVKLYDADGVLIGEGSNGTLDDDDGDNIIEIEFDTNNAAQDEAFEALDDGEVAFVVFDGPADGLDLVEDDNGQESYPTWIGCGC